MHSSTSNSDAAHASRGIKWLLAGICLVLVGLEVGTRYVAPMFFWNMRRFSGECTAALALGQKEASSGEAKILLLGNSLTFTDIDVDLLRQRLGANRELCRWAVDNTSYLDWYYGLRRAIRNGARPTVVVIGGRTAHFLTGEPRGRFFAHYILDWKDLGHVAWKTGANATGFSNMGLAQLSAFYGSREEIFKRWLTMALPSFADLGPRMVMTDASGPSGAAQPDAGDIVALRLDELRELCASCGAQLIIWIPPMPIEGANARLICEIGLRKGITVIPPLPPDTQTSWKPEDFADGFHMTPASATRFTSQFAGELERLLPKRAPGPVAGNSTATASVRK